MCAVNFQIFVNRKQPWNPRGFENFMLDFRRKFRSGIFMLTHTDETVTMDVLDTVESCKWSMCWNVF